MWSFGLSAHAALMMRREFLSNHIESGMMRISIDDEDTEDDNEQSKNRDVLFRMKNRGNIPFSYEVRFESATSQHSHREDDCSDLRVRVMSRDVEVYSGKLGELYFSRGGLLPGDKERFSIQPLSRRNQLFRCQFSLRGDAVQMPKMDSGGWTDSDTLHVRSYGYREGKAEDEHDDTESEPSHSEEKQNVDDEIPSEMVLNSKELSHSPDLKE